MRKIYAHATEEQVKMKANALQAAVKESIDITNSTTLLERVLSVVDASLGILRRVVRKHGNVAARAARHDCELRHVGAVRVRA